MTKRLIGIALVFVMLLTGAVAYASSPSITTDDFGYGVVVDGDIMYIVFRDELPEILTKLAEAVLLNIKDHILSDTLINWFSESIKTLIANLLPSDFDLNELVMYEFVSLAAEIYDDLADDVQAIFTFPTEYKEGMYIVALIGVSDTVLITEDTDIDAVIKGIKWIALKAEVIVEEVDGVITYKVRVYFTNESLKYLDAAQEIILAVLSEPLK
jgi:hypothetical protein